MVFSSITFLFYFLPLVLLVYNLVPVSWRNAVMLLAGLVFYVWGAGSFVLVLLLSVLCNWAFALFAEKANRNQQTVVRRWILAGAILLNLGLLAYFKYTNFLVNQFNQLAAWIHPAYQGLALAPILLPIGISFITFQAISYLVDVSVGRSRPLRNPVDYAMYIAMFPHSIAGPIVRYHQLEHQIPAAARPVSRDQVLSGFIRFAHGLIKKVVIADSISQLVDPTFAAGSLTPAAAWVGILGFTVQVYFDFSGYSDMAIGLARMFGFSFPENFNRPLSSVSLTDFWRRWHITLSEWFRDYVFIPLGGSRTATWKIYRNLFVVFLLVGIWHGANWTFVIFGAVQGLVMVFERLSGKRLAEDFRHVAWRRVLNLLVIMLSFVLFRASDMPHAWEYFRSLAGLASGTPVALWGEFSRESMIALALGSITFWLPGRFTFGKYLDTAETSWAAWARLGVATVGMATAVALVLSRNFISFIYFQF